MSVEPEDARAKLANLSRLLVWTLHLVQRLRKELEQAKEVTRVAVGEIADRDRALVRARAQIERLRAERTGATIGQDVAA